MKSCAICGSHAFNMATEGVNQGAFCDRHFWQRKAEALEAASATPAEGMAIVPVDAIPPALPMEPFQTIDMGSKTYKAGWNACRLAMLAAAIIEDKP